jgi:predicted transposase YbfD/YdcC
MLRAALVSSVGKTALWQLSIPPDTNEMGCCVAMFNALRAHYDALSDLVTLDAGLISKAHAAQVHAVGKGYVMAVKEGQPEWESLRQAWLVCTVHRTDDGHGTHEDRFFITNVHLGCLTPSQILRVVREHWSIENDCNWTLDQVLCEDDTPMCAAGTATLTLGFLRLLAYNLMQLARRKHLRPRTPKPEDDGAKLPWCEVPRAFAIALTRKDGWLAQVT